MPGLSKPCFLLPPTVQNQIGLIISPYNWNWPSLAYSELENACSAKVKGKTPGPDGITQDIILQAYQAIQTSFIP